ncbi:MAG: DUF3298 domain-containing protein [Rudaea sp.]
MRHFLPAGRFRVARLIAVAATSLSVASLAGCGADQPAASSASAIRAAAASERDATIDAGSGAGYKFSIYYPQLSARMAPLTAALHEFADKAKQDIVEVGTQPRSKDEPVRTLDLEFGIARNTSDFVSVLGTGSEFAGGAHGMPIEVSFNWHRSDAALVTLSDLFTDSDQGLHALSDEARRQLEGRYETRLHDEGSAMSAKQMAADVANMKRWIETGTEPKAQNFNVFLVDGLDTQAIGLTLIFSPYQVASYADGPQQVEVPAKIFYALLKPKYRDAFAIDSEAQIPGSIAR